MTTLHPRPQFVRSDWTDLSGTWEFAYDDHDKGRDSAWDTGTAAFDRTIVVPYPPESELSGIGDTGFHPVVWYRRTFTAEAGERVLLHFGAVDYRADVWVNGTLVATHEGGHTPFTADVTGALTGGEEMLVVRAEDQPEDVTQPRGKQDWHLRPHAIWYHRTTGIWQPVWLEKVPATYLADLAWTPDITAGRVRLDVTLNRPAAPGSSLRVRLRLGEEVLAEQTVMIAGTESGYDIALPAMRNSQERGRLLWSPERPTLIDAEIELLPADGTSADHVVSYVGLRSAGYGDGRLLLNGHPYYLRMVLEQGYWPQSHLAAPGADELCAGKSSSSRSSDSTARASTRRPRTRASCTGATGSACWSGVRPPTPSPSRRARPSASPASGWSSYAGIAAIPASSPGCR